MELLICDVIFTSDLWPLLVTASDVYLIFSVGYVGLGTVGAATWWYLFDDEGPQVSFYQLVSSKAILD